MAAKKKARAKKLASRKQVATLTHEEARRKNIPTAEHQSVMDKAQQNPIRVAYERRNKDLDPQLVWRGKDEQDWSDLVVHAPPLYIQEKVHSKVLIDDLLRKTERDDQAAEPQTDLFADFNGLPDDGAKTEFYQHDASWTNRMILGDSLQVMASLAEREGLRGKVQCIYLDPPYGIKFNSNFQWSTNDRGAKGEKIENITREPEQVKAFRDTWRDGVNSYLTYARDRMTVARDLLSESGSIFVQIGDENLHRITCLLDEVFGPENAVVVITFRKTNKALGASLLGGVTDYIVWYAKNKSKIKYRKLKELKSATENPSSFKWFEERMVRRRARSSDKAIADTEQGRYFTPVPLTSSGYTESCTFDFDFNGRSFSSGSKKSWATTISGVEALMKAGRILVMGNTPFWAQYFDDLSTIDLDNVWQDTRGELAKTYVVQTSSKVIERCLLMTTDPADLVIDPTCGAGTTATVAEQWGRRWITIDTSRVSLALARARIMGARYPFYLLADSRAGQQKEAELSQSAPSTQPVHGNIRHGFVYERVPHITLKSIANNAEIDVIWERWQETLEPLRAELNGAMGTAWEEWEIPRDAEDPWGAANTKLFASLHAEQAKGDKCNPAKFEKSLADINANLGRKYTPKSLPERPVDPWPEEPARIHGLWWEARIGRQREIDASIAAKADYEYLYDKPYEDKKTVRVAGPFTVESLSPHRVLGVDENDELIDPVADARVSRVGGSGVQDFTTMILDNLRTAGVQQAHKEDRIVFTALTSWPGDLISAEGQYHEGATADDDSAAGPLRRAAIFIGPEFGTVSRSDLVAAAREAGDADYDVLIACAFNFDAHSTEFEKLGRIPILKALMNADLHMADDLKNTGKGNLFVIFGEPDIDILDADDDRIQVKVNGVDVFHPQTGEIRSDGPDGIACWFIDTDYNEGNYSALGAGHPA